MLFHFGVPGAAGGWLGVDAFFVLSGYLITGLLLAERDRSGRVDLGEFWRRRVTRIGPALLFTVAVALVPVHRVSYAAAAASLFSSSNVFRGTGHNLGILTPTWTLSVEEQFYLIWPLAVFWLRTRRRVLVACAVVGSASLVLAFLDVASGQRNFPHVHAWELLTGCALAALPAVRVQAKPILANAGILTVLGAMLFAGFTARTPAIETLLSLITVVGTAMFISGVADAGHSLTTQVMSWTPVVWVGQVSYPAYLLHVPVRTALAHRVPAPNGLWPIRVVVVMAAVLVLSGVVHHGIELPVQRWARNRRRAAQVPALPVVDVRVPVRPAFVPKRRQPVGLGLRALHPVGALPRQIRNVAAGGTAPRGHHVLDRPERRVRRRAVHS